ncbi:Transposase [Bipolaris maydis]|nr:Transposase [Bipolaris maydis]
MAPYTDIYTRTLVIALKSPPIGKNTSQVAALTGVHPRTVDRIYSRAIAAGFEPNELPIKILLHHVQDAPKTGRPAKQAEEVKEQIFQQVRHDRYGREKSCADLARVEISASTVWRVLRAAGYRKTKPTRKPGLTQEMRSARLKWALEHKDWTLEDWKNVIWTDETSVVINHRRGGYRVWRKADERVVKSCIRERWKGYSEFMFWGCFSYDKKGPCHVYQPETKAEKEDAARRIEQLNAELEPLQREEWELLESMRRIGLRNKRGRKPQWRWTEKTGKLVRTSGGGIDWWRYQTCVLILKLIPFAKECLQDRPQTVVMEDKAPSYAHHY